MRVILLIAADSIRALLHQRLLVAVMLLTLILTILFSVLLNDIQEQILEQAEAVPESSEKEMDEAELESVRHDMDTAGSFVLAVFYWFTGVACTIVALFVCGTAVAGDLRRGTLSIVLAKPVSRAQFLLGKYCGAIAVVFGYSALIGVALTIFTYANQFDLSPAARFAPWLIFCQSIMAGSVVLFLSLLMHPLIAAILAFFANAAFFSSPNPIYFILPSYDRFNVFLQIVEGTLIPLEDVLTLTLYALDVAAIFLLLALWWFRFKELL